MNRARHRSRLAAVAATLLVAVGCTASPSTPAGAPRHLEGAPLAGPTGLRLLVASDPPRLLEVDCGTSRPVGGILAGQGPFSVSEVGDGAVVAGDRQVFVLRAAHPGQARAAGPAGRPGTAPPPARPPTGAGTIPPAPRPPATLRSVVASG